MKIRTGFVSNSSSSSFCILGFKVTPEILESVRQLADKSEKAKNRSPENYWCCTRCGFEPANNKIKFCEKCGGPMDTATRLEWEGEWEMFEALGMRSYKETDYGWVCGFSAEGTPIEFIIKLHALIVSMFGDVKPTIMSGEYAC